MRNTTHGVPQRDDFLQMKVPFEKTLSDDRLPVKNCTGCGACVLSRGNSTLEMDFFLRSENGLVPIEVKGENNRAQSLKTLISSKNYKDIAWGVKLVHGDVGFESNVLTLPQWCAFLLPRVVGVK